MAVFRPNLGGTSYTANQFPRRLEFGTRFAHNEFAMPILAFTFYDAFGEGSEIPHVYIRMTSSFETASRSPFQEADGIFGQPNSEVKGITGALGALGSSGLEALQRQIINAFGAGAGFLASAGLSGKSQIEFLTRQTFNNFQQLIYRGPQFRAFQLPFTMRPTSEEEAGNMRDIISLFKMASSARAGSLSEYATILGYATKDAANKSISTENKITVGPEGAQQEVYEVLQGGNSLRADLGGALTGETNFTFGYPNMCSFQLLLYRMGIGSTTLFESKKCVIEGVNVTYGSQNKLTFFDNDGGQYYPSDVNLQISLKEAVFHTHNDAADEYSNQDKTIL